MEKGISSTTEVIMRVDGDGQLFDCDGNFVCSVAGFALGLLEERLAKEVAKAKKEYNIRWNLQQQVFLRRT